MTDASTSFPDGHPHGDSDRPGASGGGPAGACPRCGYDLSALPPTWEEFCPVRGRCSECGLEVAWGEVLNEEEAPPEWFAERERGRWGSVPWMSRRTWWRALRPWSFWRSIRLRHRPDPRALRRFTLIGCAMIYLCGAAWVLYRHAAIAGRVGNPWGSAIASLVWPWPEATNHYFWITPVASIAAPLVFIVLGTSLSRAKVRGGHIWRAGVYGFLGVATIMLAFRLARVAVLCSAPAPLAGPPKDVWGFFIVCGFRSSWAMLVAGVWLAAFWWFAITRYLRLEHPRAVTASVMVIALLTGLAVVQWWPGSQWDWWRVDLFRVFFW